ncbi:ATP-binding cassette domain-containing protein [Patescibacteria group bacterium]|nr:ATP-binding cassette domain-containing protein [Patescibacteria group bacterium]
MARSAGPQNRAVPQTSTVFPPLALARCTAASRAVSTAAALAAVVGSDRAAAAQAAETWGSTVNSVRGSVLQNELLYENMSFTIHTGEKIGLIGPNGCGKSTLLKMIAGDKRVDKGSIETGGENIGYLKQSIKCELSDSVRDYLGSDNFECQKVLSSVGLEVLDFGTKVMTLSGGQKTRLGLAKVLLENPTAILMDEPTNHLDLEGLEWLEDFVKNFWGIVVIVSHDRRFLDNTVDKIFEIDPVKKIAREYSGGYSDYVKKRQEEIKRYEIDYKQQQKTKKKMEEWIVLKRQQASVFKDPKFGKQLRAMEKRIEREVYGDLLDKPKEFEGIRDLDLAGELHLDKLVLRVKDIAKRFGDKEVLKGVNLEMRGPGRVLLSGKNGSGKSTLLKIIAGKLLPDSGEMMIGENVGIGYFAQEQEELDMKKTVLDEYMSGNELDISLSTARKVLGAFGFGGDDVYKKIETLSFGQRVRLVFAKLAFGNNALLVLDEPTNHLDIPTREVVEEALKNYKGAILMVSHDRYFVENIGVTRELILEGGRM